MYGQLVELDVRFGSVQRPSRDRATTRAETAPSAFAGDDSDEHNTTETYKEGHAPRPHTQDGKRLIMPNTTVSTAYLV